MTAQPCTFEEMGKRWRKTVAECPPKHRKKWIHVFDAVGTCADDLASLEPHYVHKDRLRELRDELRNGFLAGTRLQVWSKNGMKTKIVELLTALLADPLPKGAK